MKAIYLFCVVADHYPALSFQSRQFLKPQKRDTVCAPFIMDIFTLDVMTEMLQTPLRFLSYIDKRSLYDERLHAGHELTILSYHLKRNLWLDNQYNMVALTDDISVDLDVAMLVRREGAPGEATPKGILTHLNGTTLGNLIEDIELNRNPKVLDFGFMLLTLSGESLAAINQGLENITRLSRRDGKAHDFTLGVKEASLGLTIHSTGSIRELAGPNLASHCILRKYAQRANTWFGLCVSPEDNRIRFGINFDYKWEFDEKLEKEIGNLKPPQKVQFENGIFKMRKIGRNEPCPCGSGKKYKKCCLGRVGK